MLGNLLPPETEFPDTYTALFKGYKLCVLPSPDEKRYAGSLVRQKSKCGFALFNDESGDAYKGLPLGCSE